MPGVKPSHSRSGTGRAALPRRLERPPRLGIHQALGRVSHKVRSRTRETSICPCYCLLAASLLSSSCRPRANHLPGRARDVITLAIVIEIVPRWRNFVDSDRKPLDFRLRGRLRGRSSDFTGGSRTFRDGVELTTCQEGPFSGPFLALGLDAAALGLDVLVAKKPAVGVDELVVQLL